jgi:hypothetical protein
MNEANKTLVGSANSDFCSLRSGRFDPALPQL